jgi:beta-glucosidase
LPDRAPLTLDYQEGADVGLRWYAAKGLKPQFAFGYGLTYTSFAYSALNITGGRRPKATLTVTNTGNRAGRDVPQIYLTAVDGKPTLRLAGFDSLTLAPGESRTITIDIDPKLLAHWVTDSLRVSSGVYEFSVGRSAADLVTKAAAHIPVLRLSSP